MSGARGRGPATLAGGARVLTGERGSTVVVVAAALVVAAGLVLGLGRLGTAALARARAQTAADAAALAAADTLALGRGAAAAAAAARETAASNGATLERCRCTGRLVDVEVARPLGSFPGLRGEVRARARAEIAPEIRPVPPGPRGGW